MQEADRVGGVFIIHWIGKCVKCQCGRSSFPCNKRDRLLSQMERVPAGGRLLKPSAEFHFGLYLKSVFVLAFKSPFFGLKQRLSSMLRAQRGCRVEAPCSRDGCPGDTPAWAQGDHPCSFTFFCCVWLLLGSEIPLSIRVQLLRMLCDSEKPLTGKFFPSVLLC